MAPLIVQIWTRSGFDEDRRVLGVEKYDGTRPSIITDDRGVSYDLRGDSRSRVQRSLPWRENFGREGEHSLTGNHRKDGFTPLETIRSTKAAKGRYDISNISMAFQKMGNGHCGSLLEAPGKLKYLIVAIDYFTKWLEAKPLASITGRQVKNFAFDNIFRTGEFVLRKNKVSKAESTCKLGPKWEGAYEVIEAYKTGAYKLRNINGKEVPRTWHRITYLENATPDGSLPPDEKYNILKFTMTAKGKTRQQTNSPAEGKEHKSPLS
ncbi:reverse transcriptase domain-containing protein [Tanacetum coccineum]|uniref:Reverse transcriptase domain-containing protein n=1 Tax=Tanacetum coccineum TaxID=301880 RepID=A0ABQ4ZF03_9ASTR